MVAALRFRQIAKDTQIAELKPALRGRDRTIPSRPTPDVRRRQSNGGAVRLPGLRLRSERRQQRGSLLNSVGGEHVAEHLEVGYGRPDFNCSQLYTIHECEIEIVVTGVFSLAGV